MTFTEDVTIEHEGRSYTLPLDELRQTVAHDAAWMNPAGRPSSGLVDRVYAAALRTGAPEAAARELTARALGITVDKVKSSLEFEAGYVRAHDGDKS